MYGYTPTQGYTPGFNSTYTTPSAAAAAVAAAYSGSTNAAAQQAMSTNVFGYPSASMTTGLDSAAASGYYAYGYGGTAGTSMAPAYGGLHNAAANYALSDLSYAASAAAKKGLASTYGATAPKANPALTTLTTTNKGVSSTGYSYDAAVYAAASNMLHGKPTFPSKKKNPFAMPSASAMGGTAAPTHKYGGSGKRWGVGATAATHREPQQFYCEVCKISCAGQLTYKEHLDGKLHKKKEALQKGENQQSLPKSKVSFRCDLCNVTCTGKDTYDAHVRGTKHQRTLSLCKKLGKPIPANEPTIIAPADMGGTIPPPRSVNVGGGGANVEIPGGAKLQAIGHNANKKIAPIPFVGGSSLSTTQSLKDLEAKKAAVAAAVGSAGSGVGDGGVDTPVQDEKKKKELEALLAAESAIAPVGENFVESEKDANGKHVTYVCKLCDCKFSDINAKDIHLKGRRHRLQYKLKVDSSLEVESKPNNLREKRALRLKEKIAAQRMNRAANTTGPGFIPPSNMARFAPALPPRPYFDAHRYIETEDDRHIMTKHSTIFMNEEDLESMDDMVQGVEKALKGVSDEYESRKSKEEEGSERLLKGAMRIGVLSKGLMLKDEEEVELVALFSKVPTKNMLEETGEIMKKYIQATDYTIEANPDETCLMYKIKDRLPRVKIFFTSTVLRHDGTNDGESADKPSDMLREDKCLEALAQLRHAKWFQVRCTTLQSCQVVLRILRDVRRRVNTWNKLTPWMTELLVEKVIVSVGVPIPVGDALRRFFEAISTGILYKCGPGIIDPCEKEVVNVLDGLTDQEREDMTSSGQHALRLIAFGQMHKILGMDKLTPLPIASERKRPRDNTGTSEDDAKKDKPDSGDEDKTNGETEKTEENKTKPVAVPNVKMEEN